MPINTRRNFFGKIAAIPALVTGAPKLFSQQAAQPHAAPAGAPTPRGPAPAVPGGDCRGRSGNSNHAHDGIYYFSGTGSNDSYPKEDHVLLTDPFEKPVTRPMDAPKKSVERAGCTKASILHLQV